MTGPRLMRWSNARRRLVRVSSTTLGILLGTMLGAVMVAHGFVRDATIQEVSDPVAIVTEAQRRTDVESLHYDGTLEVIDSRGKIADKRWVYDRLGSHGSSKAVLTFTEPAEVRGVALLIVNHVDRASDQWMWTPAIQRERRIATQDRSTRFFGTDFSFEDLEESDVEQYEYRMLGEEAIDGVACWTIESRPTERRSSQYTRSIIWVRQDNYAHARIEKYRRDGLERRLDYRQIERVQGVWTPLLLEMHDLGRDSRTILTIEKLVYNTPMRDEDFTLRALRRRR